VIFVRRNDALSWGRVVRRPQHVASPRFRDELPRMLSLPPSGSVLPIGLQRSYGDSGLNSAGGLISTTGLDRFISLDLETGMLKAEAGISLGEIIRRVVPQGFFLPVTPGTRFVTLGGAIANDVHGKNHHRAGTFGRHVSSFKLLRHDGSQILSPAESSNGLFEATIGGLGLTGLIEWAEIKLEPVRSGFLDAEILPYGGLSEFWDIAEASATTHEHTVAWFDCTARGPCAGRGIFSRASWRIDGELVPHSDRRRLWVLVDAPTGLLNPLTVKLFNRLYYAAQKRKAGAVRLHYSQFFHPLDSIANWNRLYGRHGFWQYQCIVPPSTMKDAIAALLDEIALSEQASFLAVLKTCGPLPSPGILSFPMEGATLALDFPNRGVVTDKLFSRLDAIVADAGGRLYAAKDGRIPKAVWARGYPNMGRFLSHIDQRFSSDFWRRVAP
jgi:FAD/FMN-containing dehydrogenase